MNIRFIYKITKNTQKYGILSVAFISQLTKKSQITWFLEETTH